MKYKTFKINNANMVTKTHVNTHLLVQRVCVTVEDHNVLQLGQHLHLLLPHQNLGHQPCKVTSTSQSDFVRVRI